MPIPGATIGPRYRSLLGLPPITPAESANRNLLISLARKLSQVTANNGQGVQELHFELDAVISMIYNSSKEG